MGEASYANDELGRPLFRCKWCKESGLIWTETERGWRLSDGIVVHRCSSYQEPGQPGNPRAKALRDNEARLSKVAEQISKGLYPRDTEAQSDSE